MNCLSEAIGMALPGNGTIPAVMAARLRLAKESGMQIMTLLAKKITPRTIMTEKAFANSPWTWPWGVRRTRPCTSPPLPKKQE